TPPARRSPHGIKNVGRGHDIPPHCARRKWPAGGRCEGVAELRTAADGPPLVLGRTEVLALDRKRRERISRRPAGRRPWRRAGEDRRRTRGLQARDAQPAGSTVTVPCIDLCFEQK